MTDRRLTRIHNIHSYNSLFILNGFHLQSDGEYIVAFLDDVAKSKEKGDISGVISKAAMFPRLSHDVLSLMKHPYLDVASKLPADYTLKVVAAYHAGKPAINNEWRNVVCPYTKDNQFREKGKPSVDATIANMFELLQTKEKAVESVVVVVPGGEQLLEPLPELCRLLWLISAQLRARRPQSQLGIPLRPALWKSNTPLRLYSWRSCL